MSGGGKWQAFAFIDAVGGRRQGAALWRPVGHAKLTTQRGRSRLPRSEAHSRHRLRRCPHHISAPKLAQLNRVPSNTPRVHLPSKHWYSMCSHRLRVVRRSSQEKSGTLSNSSGHRREQPRRRTPEPASSRMFSVPRPRNFGAVGGHRDEQVAS